MFPSFSLCAHPLLFTSSFMQQLHAHVSTISGPIFYFTLCHTPECDEETESLFCWVLDNVALKSVFMAWASISSFFVFIVDSYTNLNIAAFVFYYEALGFSNSYFFFKSPLNDYLSCQSLWKFYTKFVVFASGSKYCFNNNFYFDFVF